MKVTVYAAIINWQAIDPDCAPELVISGSEKALQMRIGELFKKEMRIGELFKKANDAGEFTDQQISQMMMMPARDEGQGIDYSVHEIELN